MEVNEKRKVIVRGKVEIQIQRPRFEFKYEMKFYTIANENEEGKSQGTNTADGRNLGSRRHFSSVQFKSV